MTLSLRTWRYGSKASARHIDDPVGMLTIRALREAHVAGQPGEGDTSAGERDDRAAHDDSEAISQSDYR